jgi:hypothetical protein
MPVVKQFTAHGFWEEKMSRLKIVWKAVFWAKVRETKRRGIETRIFRQRSRKSIVDNNFL